MRPSEEVKSSMEFSLCRGCRRNLKGVYIKFKWYVSRGYSQKDAAARVLYNPGDTKDISECCILNLQTNYDSNKELIDRALLKENAKRAELERIKGETGRLPERPVVRIFSANETKTIGGGFILEDVPIIYDKNGKPEDIQIKTVSDLIPPYPPVEHTIDPVTGLNIQHQPAIRVEGFHITNISLIPKSIMQSRRWRGLPFLILWSGNMKIIPVINRGGELVPANMYLQFIDPVTGLENIQLIDRFDKSLLEAEIIDYRQYTLNLSDSGLLTVEGITLRKQFPQDIIG